MCKCRRLETCCCCASVKTGTIITGTLGIVLSIATIVFIWIYHQRYTFVSDNGDGKNENWLGISNTTMKIILTVNLVMTILLSALMLVGAIKRRSWLMLPWVVLGVVLPIGALITILHTSITMFLRDDAPATESPLTTTTLYPDQPTPKPVYYPSKSDYTFAATVILVGGLIYLAVFIYLWVVVFSHFLNIKDEEERGRYMKTPYRR